MLDGGSQQRLPAARRVRVTVNLAPADVRKEGSRPTPRDRGRGGRRRREGETRQRHRGRSRWARCLLGELSLFGEVRPVRGLLPIVLDACGSRREPPSRCRPTQAWEARAGCRDGDVRAFVASPRRSRGTCRDGQAAGDRRARAGPNTGPHARPMARRSSIRRCSRSRRAPRSSPRPAATTCCSSGRPAWARRGLRGYSSACAPTWTSARRSPSRASTAQPVCSRAPDSCADRRCGRPITRSPRSACSAVAPACNRVRSRSRITACCCSTSFRNSPYGRSMR